MAGLTAEQNALLGMLLQAVEREQAQESNPFVAARLKEDEIIRDKGQQNHDVVQNCVVRLDSDGDILILFETAERRFCFIVILESSDGTIGWKETQLVKILIEFSARGNIVNNETFLEVCGTLKGKFQAVEFGLNADRRLACKIKPGAGGLMDVNGKIFRTTLMFDEEKNEFTMLMFCAPPAALQASKPPSVFAFNIELLHSGNQLGIAESHCLARCISLAEPGDDMDESRFFACCGLMQKAYNQAAMIEQSVQGMPVKICVIRPTLIDRAEPIEPRFAQALELLELQGMLAVAARLGHGAETTSTSSASTARSAQPENCEYPGVTKGEKIADSGQATVYKGKHDDKVVAIKIFKGDRQALAAYKDELKALLKLGPHKNVIGILDFFETPRPCIIMRYVEGGTLWDSIETRGKSTPFSASDALRLAQGIADGIAHLHTNGILHRDLKSTNILLDKNNEPVIIDLGLGKRLDSSLARAQHTMATKGSYFWLAPEMSEKGEYSDKNDTYALGIILYEIYACSHPYEPADLVNEHVFMKRIIDGSLRPKADKLPGTTPAWMKKLMQDCWASNPKDRPSIAYVQRAVQSKGENVQTPMQVFVAHAGSITKGLDKAAFSKCLGALAPKTTDKERLQLFEVMDNDENGMVDWDEFREWWAVIEQKGIHFAISILHKSVPDHQVMTHMEATQMPRRGETTDRQANKPMLRAMSSGRLVIQQSASKPKSVDDVVDWCVSYGLDNLADVFKKEKVDGDGLESLHEMSLGEIQEFLSAPDVPRGQLLKLKKQLKDLYGAPH